MLSHGLHSLEFLAQEKKEKGEAKNRRSSRRIELDARQGTLDYKPVGPADERLARGRGSQQDSQVSPSCQEDDHTVCLLSCS